MTGAGIAFGVALAVTGLCAIASPRPMLSGTAWACLALGWFVTIAIAPYGARYVWIWPAMDAAFGTLAMTAAFRFKTYWPAMLGLLFLGQCTLHIAWNFMGLYAAPDPLRVYRYYQAINLLLVAQMVCVSWPGLANGGAVLFDRIRRLSRNRSRAKVAL